VSTIDSLATSELVERMADEAAIASQAVRSCSSQVAAFIDDLVPRMRNGGRLIYIGAGSSGRLGVLDASECPPTFQSDPEQVQALIAGGDAALRRSSEHREDDPAGAHEAMAELALGPLDSVVGIAAGGTTPWVLGGMEHARSLDCLVCFIRCADAGPVDVDHLIDLQTGPELLTGSTRMKAGTATKIVLNSITTGAYTALGKVHRNRMVDLRATNEKLHDRAIRILLSYAPDLDREAADLLLDGCDGELKTAIVSACMGTDPASAREAIAAVDGRIGDIPGCFEDENLEARD